MEQARPETILAALIITESMILAEDTTVRFNEALQQHLDNGWKQHGAIFVADHYIVVNLVRYDQRVQPLVDKALLMISAQLEF
jgi:hypothetical protein